MKYQNSYNDIKKYSKKYAYLSILASIAIFAWITYKSSINIMTIASTSLLSTMIILINEFSKNKNQEILTIITFIALALFGYIILREIKLGNIIDLQANALAAILSTYGIFGIILKIKKYQENKFQPKNIP